MVKFDYIIGNPPYQEELKDTSDRPIYNYFMDAVYEVADKVELITPARFLFNAGKTPKVWNEKMLNDPHLKVLTYEQEAERVFPCTSIRGGVVITYHDLRHNYGAIGVFTSNELLNQILNKVVYHSSFKHSLNEIMILQNRWNFKALYQDYPDAILKIGSKGKERRLTTSIFTTVPEVFNDSKQDVMDVCVYGIVNTTKRISKWVSKKYLLDNGVLNEYAVLICKSSPSGFGEIITRPFVKSPDEAYTQSFIGIGPFEKAEFAQNVIKYLSTKFCRNMLGVLKITQDNPPEKWKYVPLQDFTSSSDIDWSASIPNIDRQLYRKYGLTHEEIDFIEKHVKPME